MMSENRNSKLGLKLNVYRKLPDRISGDWKSPNGEWMCNHVLIMHPIFYNVVLLEDTILKIDRIFIRKGSLDFSSVSFWIKSGPYKGARFWAKLEDVNRIKFITLY